jgi:hypothetical protein
VSREELDRLELGDLRAVVPSVSRVGKQLKVGCRYGCPLPATSDVAAAIQMLVAHTQFEAGRP